MIEQAEIDNIIENAIGAERLRRPNRHSNTTDTLPVVRRLPLEDIAHGTAAWFEVWMPLFRVQGVGRLEGHALGPLRRRFGVDSRNA